MARLEGSLVSGGAGFPTPREAQMLPLGAAGFLGWMLTKTLQSASAPQVWSLVGIVGLGLIMLLCARFVLRSGFFQIPRESDQEG
jgi:hypothetical protein